MYMDDPTTIAVEPTYNSLQLKGPSGLLKGNLQMLHRDKKRTEGSRKWES